MKKLLLLGFALIAFNSYAQKASFGIKAGMVYNADDGVVKTLNDTHEDRGKGSVGFQAGAMLRINTGGLYVQPELLYTSFKNEYDAPDGNSFEVGKRRMDVPVNLGTTFLTGLIHVQAGPVFSYYFEDKITLDDVHDAERDEFNVGFQLGTGLNIKNIVLDVRYEFGFGKHSSQFVQDTWGFETENRSQLLNFSVGYFF